MQTPGFYEVLKGRSYGIAQIASGCSNGEAQAKGFADVFGMVVSDSDHARQASFLLLLSSTVPVKAHRQIILDGMAREYANSDSWMAYVEKESG